MSQTGLEIALKKHLNDAALGYDVAWPNQYLNDTDEPFLVIQMLRGDVIRLGTNGADAHFYTGIFQVTVMTQFGKSTRIANEISDQVVALFPAGLRIGLTSGYCDIVRNPVVQAGYKDDGHWRTPVDVNYRAKF